MNNFTPVQAKEPEALEASAALLSDPLGRATARMRKNVWALRDRIFPSGAPLCCAEPRRHLEGGAKVMSYASANNAVIPEDVKLDRRLEKRNARQLEKILKRSVRRAQRMLEASEKQVQPTRRFAMQEQAKLLGELARAADLELRHRRGTTGIFLNPDGN